MIKERMFSFLIDVFLLKFFISLVVKNTSINPNLEDIIFLSSFSSYYIFSNIIFKKTLGKKVLKLKSESIREGRNKEIWFVFDIILKYIFILPIVLMFTELEITIHWSDFQYGGLHLWIFMIYLACFSISDKLLHDKFTKIKVVKEE